MSSYKPTREDARRALDDARQSDRIYETSAEVDHLQSTLESLDNIDAPDAEYHHVYQEARCLI